MEQLADAEQLADVEQPDARDAVLAVAVDEDALVLAVAVHDDALVLAVAVDEDDDAVALGDDEKSGRKGRQLDARVVAINAQGSISK